LRRIVEFPEDGKRTIWPPMNADERG